MLFTMPIKNVDSITASFLHTDAAGKKETQGVPLHLFSPFVSIIPVFLPKIAYGLTVAL